jgi:hypothetical protein
MPVQLVRAPGHSRRRGLGRLALWWIETFTLHGRGDGAGLPVRFGDEYAGFIMDCYALDAHGRRLYDTAFFSRPKGTNKSGVAAKLCLFEGLGPARFAGWAEGGETYTFLGVTYTYAAGEAMGRPVKNPLIRILATEEGQTGNTYEDVLYNLTDHEETGVHPPLLAMNGYGMDARLSDIRLPYGGRIVPSTAGNASKDGGLETFVVADETHLYTTPTLRSMYDTVRRNLAKRAKAAEPWLLETTTMYSPGSNSVAEATYDYAKLIQEGHTRRKRLLFNHRWADLPLDDMTKVRKVKAAVIEALGEAADEDANGQPTAGWVNVDRYVDDAFDPRTRVADFYRFYLNDIVAAADAWLSVQDLNGVVVGSDEVHSQELETSSTVGAWRRLVGEREEITLGFDGSIDHDATALVGCRVSDGLLFPIRVDEQPDGPESKDWRVDEGAFDDAVAAMFRNYRVVAFFADPPFWQTWIDKWGREYGARLRLTPAPKETIRFYTNRPTQMIAALERFHTAVRSGELKVLADPQLVRHLRNARVRQRPAGDLIFKESPKSPKKIDAAMAAVLAYEARARVVADANQHKNRIRVPIRL